MGNTASDNLAIELYKWSSAEFPQEYALIYSSLIHESKFTIFRFSVKPEKVLLRLADSLCDDHHPVRLHMEIIAQKEDDDNNNNSGTFNCRIARVVEAGTSQEQIPLRNEVIFSYLCDTGACAYHVRRHGGNYVHKRTWEVWYSCVVGLRNRLRFYVNIECDKVTGLSVKFRGPFKFYGHVLAVESWLGLERSASMIQREVNGEPPKHVNAFLESEFTGKECILFQQGKWYSGTNQGARVTVNNTGGYVHGNGHGSSYENCHIVMNYNAAQRTN